MRCAGIYHPGAEATAALLKKAYGVEVSKALDPLDKEDFLVLCARLAKALENNARDSEVKALKEALEALDADWSSLTEDGMERVFQSAAQKIAVVGAVVAPTVSKLLTVRADALIASTKKSAIKKYGFSISSSFNRYDKRTSGFLAASNGLYVTNEFGVRSEALAKQARKIVMDGLEAGLGRVDISARLVKDIQLAQLGRTKNYWDFVASSFANRARTSTQLNSFLEAGITVYKFVAVMDAVTTEICRYMDGRTLSVEAAVKRQRETEGLDNPEDIKDAQPWVRNGKDEEGNNILYYKRGGERFTVAHIVQSAVGQDDKAGTFSKGMDTLQLEAAGIQVPPLHGKCRSDITIT